MSNQQLLSVPYAENVTGDPAGTVNAFAGVFTPQLEAEGWLPCDGRIVSKDDYPELFNAIQEYWGNGDDGYYDEPTQAGGNFNLPDMRGMFLRGVDATAGNDPDVASRTANNGGNSGDNVGSHQADEFKTHTHKVGSQTTRGDSTSWQHQDIDLNSGDIRNCAASGGSETRPKNVYVNYIIKVR